MSHSLTPDASFRTIAIEPKRKEKGKRGEKKALLVT